MVWGKAGSTTLTATGNAMTVSSLPNSVFGMALGTHTAGGTDIKLNGDTSSNYAVRRNTTGSSSENTNAGVSDAYITDSRSNPHFNVTYFCNISGEEKLWINHNVHQGSSGAGNAMYREEAVGKWTGTGVVTSFEYHNWSGSTYASGDNVSVLGSDITPAAAVPAVPFGDAVSDVPDYTRAEITDTRKMYSLRPTSVTLTDDFSSSSGYTFGTGNSISGGVLTCRPASTSLGFTKALGFTLDNDKWVMRIHGWEVQSGYSWSSSMVYMFGFSDQSGLVAYNGSGNNFGFQIFNRNSGGMINNVRSKLNGTGGTGGNSSVGEGGTNLVVGTKYYIECKRTSATSGELRIYSDSDFTTLHSTAYISDATMNAATGLDYFSLQAQTGGGTHVVNIDKIVVYNGVTEADEGGWKEKGTI